MHDNCPPATHSLSAEQLLWLLQLASPGLPVGAYAYSEGVEALTTQGIICDRTSLQTWLDGQLQYGAIRIEIAIMLRALAAWPQPERLAAWNAWLSASWETEELRAQSWQMGRSLLRLLGELIPEARDTWGDLPETNWAIAWGIAMALQEMPPEVAALAYGQAWATNLIGAGVKLIPLGQTAGQQIWLHLQGRLQTTVTEVLAWEDEDLESCNWGSAIASLAHQTQRVRLFRS